jgi:hypothetical protein
LGKQAVEVNHFRFMTENALKLTSYQWSNLLAHSQKSAPFKRRQAKKKSAEIIRSNLRPSKKNN